MSGDSESLEIIRRLVEVMEAAIASGDWKVDGACEPSSALGDAEWLLSENGYRRDGLTGTEFIKE